MIDQQAIAAAISEIEGCPIMTGALECENQHNGVCGHCGMCEPIKTALAALRECAERRENKPLTLDELKARGNKPVWFESEQEGNAWGFALTVYGYVQIADFYGSDYGIKESDYGKTWLAYDHERGDT